MTCDPLERSYFTDDLAYWGADVATPDFPFLPDARDGRRILVAPAHLEPQVRRVAEAGRAGTEAAPRRFVFYTYDDEPRDRWSETKDAIMTTALSRARIITAVAVAAGRASPEIEAAYDLGALATPREPPDRERAVRNRDLILLVEDHPLNRDVIVRQLHLLGYAVDTAENGAEALRSIADTRYGLILTDCSMPGMDGFELTRRIRCGETGGTRLPIVALTANLMAGEAERCLAAGMNACLSKPIEMARLRDCLQRWLPSQAAPDGSYVADGSATARTELSGFLDLTLLAECFGDDEATMLNNLERFGKAMNADIQLLSAAIEKNSTEETKLAAHRLRGAAGFVGGSAVAAASEAIELLSQAGNWSAVAREWPRLLAASAEIEQHIETRRRTA
jgi:CheY-like chemotaxis protein/HPt (histidine-containing phosphotransfer) domain-containing protein